MLHRARIPFRPSSESHVSPSRSFNTKVAEQSAMAEVIAPQTASSGKGRFSKPRRLIPPPAFARFPGVEKLAKGQIAGNRAKETPRETGGKDGGRYRTRICDLLHVKQAL